MLTGIDREETFGFSVAGDQGEKKTIFQIGNLSNREKIKLVGEILNADGTVDLKKIQDRAIDIFIKGVKRVENFIDPKTKAEVTVEKVDEAFVDSIPFVVVCEVASKVIEVNFVSEEERKN